MMGMIDNEMRLHLETIQKSMDEIQSYIYTACVIVTDTLAHGNKVLLCGNGGSAADAQHIAAELTGRYKTERRGLPGIALTTDTSALTAIANDYGYDRVFDRQVEALAREGDLLIGISTSGNSKNVNNALKVAKELGCRTIGFSGRDGGGMSELCDVNIVVPSDDTPRIQEMHILIGHIMCQAIDDSFS
ncbi:MAG TPA: D-sedoheptulose 7-phosphate isomerase [Campylobacterales bacterium]|nr:D-sedoheptulose 7-phosphate isomerase [Campylobacterales bacterium]HIP60549.1 D-sedoheptulose 7-phosphate isomerase [Campylobacterales bacterium]